MVGNVNNLQCVAKLSSYHELTERNFVVVRELRQSLYFCPRIETAVVMWLQNVHYKAMGPPSHNYEVRVEWLFSSLLIRHTKSPIAARKISQPTDKVALSLSPPHECAFPAVQIRR